MKSLYYNLHTKRLSRSSILQATLFPLNHALSRERSRSQFGKSALAIQVGDVTAVDVTQSAAAAQLIRQLQIID
jgi:hypothetical protein